MSARPLILVVDDDQPIRLLMRSLLNEFGFEPLIAGSGDEAIAAARSRRPDLMLLDKNMPGKSGEEVIRTLRAEPDGATIPILLLTGDPVDANELARLGADGWVQKPFDVIALVERIRATLGT